MEIDLDDLEAKCRAATPGPWTQDLCQVGKEWLKGRIQNCVVNDAGVVAIVSESDPDAEYMAAANPALTLELIAQLRKAREERNKLLVALKEARDMVNDWGGHASGYFQDKYNLDGDITKLDAVIGKMAGVEFP